MKKREEKAREHSQDYKILLAIVEEMEIINTVVFKKGLRVVPNEAVKKNNRCGKFKNTGPCIRV